MTVKHLIENFDTRTPYIIVDVENPHNIIWKGKGNKPTQLCDKNIVCGVSHNPKHIIIYITGQWDTN